MRYGRIESQLDIGSTLRSSLDGQGSGTNTWRVILVATVYAPRALSMGMHHIAYDRVFAWCSRRHGHASRREIERTITGVHTPHASGRGTGHTCALRTRTAGAADGAGADVATDNIPARDRPPAGRAVVLARTSAPAAPPPDHLAIRSCLRIHQQRQEVSGGGEQLEASIRSRWAALTRDEAARTNKTQACTPGRRPRRR